MKHRRGLGKGSPERLKYFSFSLVLPVTKLLLLFVVLSIIILHETHTICDARVNYEHYLYIPSKIIKRVKWLIFWFLTSSCRTVPMGGSVQYRQLMSQISVSTTWGFGIRNRRGNKVLLQGSIGTSVWPGPCNTLLSPIYPTEDSSLHFWVYPPPRFDPGWNSSSSPYLTTKWKTPYTVQEEISVWTRPPERVVCPPFYRV